MSIDTSTRIGPFIDTVDDEAPPTAPDAVYTPAPPVHVARWANGDTFALGAVFFSVFALLASIIAIAFAARAISEAGNSAGNPAAAAPPSAVVELKEFSITPGQLDLTAGNALVQVNNIGTVGHDLHVEGLQTPLIDAGGQATLDLSSLAAGEYAIICTIAGHADSGMTGTVTIK